MADEEHTTPLLETTLIFLTPEPVALLVPQRWDSDSSLKEEICSDTQWGGRSGSDFQKFEVSLQALLCPLHALSRTLQTHSYEILPTFLQNIYFFCSYSSKFFLKGHERAFRGRESA